MDDNPRHHDVTDNIELRRFEIRTDGAAPDGAPAGFAEYRLRPDAIVFLHTEVQPRYEGKGVGSALIRGALDQARAQGRRVVALCPFVKAYIERHPGYQDLLAS